MTCNSLVRLVRLDDDSNAVEKGDCMSSNDSLTLVGYARVSITEQDLQPQLDGLALLGVTPESVHIDFGLTGTNRERPALREGLAACREGVTLVVTKLDRLGRSMSDLMDIANKLTAAGASLNVNGQLHDPSEPSGRLFFSMFSMMAEFEADIIRQRMKEGLVVAKRNGRLKGKQPRLNPEQDMRVLKMYGDGEHTVGEIAESFHVSRASAYRAIERARRASQETDT